MKHILLLVMTFLSFSAHADLLERIQLEDNIRSRIESVLRPYDKDSKALVRIEFKKYDGVLPGMAMLASDSSSPLKIESTDVDKVWIEIYSQDQTAAKKVEGLIYQQVPVEKARIQLSYKTMEKTPNVTNPFPLDSETFQKVYETTTRSMSWTLVFALVACTVLTFGFFFYQNNVRLREFKAQMTALATAISESSSYSQAIPVNSPKEQSASLVSPEFASEASQRIENFDSKGLLELFFDCYWCEEDGYAHWLWKQLSFEKQRQLVSEFAPLKNYVTYFVSSEPQALAYHEHPYYLNPSAMKTYSQEQVSAEVKKTPGLWHSVSPMRQERMDLPFADKLKATQSAPASAFPALTTASKPRSFAPTASWGQLRPDDELALFQNPEMVPAALRPHVQSLIWLAHKSDAFVQSVLAQYDARSLASAWVGPQEVLSRLEVQLPEKKRALLKTYLEKTTPSRHSSVYVSLVQEGHREEAA